MEKKITFMGWLKAHKIELMIAGGAVVGTVLIVKNWDAIKDIFRTAESNIPELPKVEPVANKIGGSLLSNNILDNLSGNKLTARALGSKVGYSAQAISKRILGAGLITRLPCGEYMMSETGHLLGNDTWKITASGHSFSNIEWDEKILKVIFSPKELFEIIINQERARQVLAA